jgi:CelD/BcsL family acetyltransferase involved in cellulose biosynthesis
MHYLLPERKVLPLQAIDPEGNCIASMLTVASNDTAFLWGSTSWRRFQYLRPNELLMWSSIQHWKSRGIRKFDMGGGGEYKRKYGGYEISVPWLRASKYAGLESLRATAVQAVRFQQRLRALSKHQGASAGLPPVASTEHAA